MSRKKPAKIKEAAQLLERAIAIAVSAHAGQRDKSGNAYILHPLRLMLKTHGDHERMAAVLHDVVEDTPWTLAALRKEGFPEEVIAAVDCLTKRPGEDYEKFVERLAGNPVARRVKIADIEDNLDVRRLPVFGPKDGERVAKYLAAWRKLTALETAATRRARR